MTWENTKKTTLKKLEQAIVSFPWEDPGAYAQWLGQTFHFVNNSTRLLALASARTPFDQPALHNRFIDHAKEERGHDKLLLADLKALGRKIEEIPEAAATAGLYKSQYYWIDHNSPSAFMGWILVLESAAAYFGPTALNRVLKAHGEKASMFWKVHALEDQDHVQKALSEVDKLGAKEKSLVELNFAHSGEFYVGLLQHCSASAKDTMKRAA